MKRNAIAVLPKEVVDQIAAGEVVQRPVSVVKELLENSLDAGSSHIVIHVEKGGLGKLVITDDGCGIPKSGLALAATRHATSKLTTVDDFENLQTFGFRGEALASISTVSRLSVTSRIEDSQVGFSQTYRNGSPTLKQPKPCARKKGTTITVQDLFYNVPHRLKTYSKRESEEYNKILTVLQNYAIYYPYAGFVCERTRAGNKIVDVNTSQLQHVKSLIQKRRNNPDITVPQNDPDYVKATKQIMAHVFESNLEKNTLHFESSSDTSTGNDFTYNAQVFYTSPFYDAKTTKFVLFLNDRLVDLPVLKRSCEEVYATNCAKVKPILVIKVKVPGAQVDVNVHPSKRQVALMYQDELCTAICDKLRDVLQQYGQTFQAESVAPIIANPYKRKRKQSTISVNENGENETSSSSKTKTTAGSIKKKTPPSRLVRTSGATPVGAIEPFLVPTQSSQKRPLSQSSQESMGNTPNSASFTQDSTTSMGTASSHHSNESRQPQNSLSTKSTQSTDSTTIDFSQPGAFASALQEDRRKGVMIRKPLLRPKRVTPSECTYVSIASLRKRVNKETSDELCQTFRDAYFVGVMSHQRSLIQCGDQLIMINHLELAKLLFYQLALARFSGAVMAQLGENGSGGVNIQTVIAQALQVEDDLVLPEENGDRDDVKKMLEQKTGLLPVNEANENFASDATSCLEERSVMLEEYFSIQIERKDDGGDAILTGLPVLLDGHVPEPHGLPIFLLRLATQVDWNEEKRCFHGICQELGNYYAMLPTENYEAYVRHTLFPAISYLLNPPERIKTDGSFTTMTQLSTLYKVFERC